MQDMQEHALVEGGTASTPSEKRRTHAAHGITALFSALRRQKHGLALGLYRVKSNRLVLPDIEVLSIKGHHNLAVRYGQHMSDVKPCRVLIADAGYRERVIMDVESFAFLLDAAISSDPSHFLRRTHAVKDTDE